MEILKIWRVWRGSGELEFSDIIADKMSLIFNDEGSQVSFWRNEFEVALFQTNKIYGFELLDESDYTRKTIKTFKLKGVI